MVAALFSFMVVSRPSRKVPLFTHRFPHKPKRFRFRLGTPAGGCLGVGEVAKHGAKTKRRIQMARGRRADKIKTATALELSEKLGHSERQIAKEVGLPASTVHTILSKAHGWGEIADEPVFRQNRAQQNRALKQAARSMAAKAMERAEDKIDDAGFYHLTPWRWNYDRQGPSVSRRKHAKRSDPVEKRSHEPGSPCRCAFSGVAGV